LEANHVWLILVIVLLFTAFPSAFSTTMIALHIPINRHVDRIVLRGSAFVFRKYDSTEDAVQRRWSTIFGIASFFTPFFPGVNIGRVDHRGHPFRGRSCYHWLLRGLLTPFALTCGLFALALFAFLAATYMTVDTQDQPDLQNDFRLRALWTQMALIPPGDHSLCYFKNMRPPIHGILIPGSDQLVGAAPARVDGCLSAIAATLALWFRKFYLARIAAVAEVTFILLGWGLAQFPHLVTPDVTIQNAAAPESTLKLLLLALGAGAVVLLPSLFYLFQIFKRQEQQ